MRALQLYLRALGAAAFLAFMLFGLPVLLWALIGNPLPAWDALQVGDFSDDVVLHIMATIAWLGWASFALMVVVEARAQSLERPAPALPGLPGQQEFTRSLLAALVLAAPTLAVTATTVHQPGILPDTHDPHRPGTTSAQAFRTAATERQGHPRLHTAPVSHESAPTHERPPADPSPQAPAASGTSPAQTYLLGTASGIGASLAAAGLHTVVVRRRRHQHAARQPGHLPEAPTPDAARVERHLVTSAWLAQALRERLQTALHHLDAALRAENRHPVVFLAARLDAERTELIPVHPLPAPPPSPWEVEQASGHWILKDGAVLEAHHRHHRPASGEDAHHRWAWIGFSKQPGHQQRSGEPPDSDVWLLNLTAAASVRILGAPGRTVDLVRAVLLSQAPLPAPPATSDTVDTAAEVVVRTNAHDLMELAHLVDARAAPADEKTAPGAAIVVVDQRQYSADEPVPGVTSVRGSSTIVVTEDLRLIGTENVRLVIDVTGQLHLSFRQTPITSALITRRDLDWASPLLIAARAIGQRPAPWASGPTGQPALDNPTDATVAGNPPSPYSLEPAPPEAIPHDPAPTPAHAPAPSQSAEPQPTGPPPGQTLPSVEDPTLDADLQVWHSEHTTRPRLRLLGPVEVRAAGTPRRGDRIPWQTEIVALFHAYPQGLTMGEFTDKMWPHDADRKAATAMPRQAISGVRHWLSIDPDTGTHYLPKLPPRDADARYRINHLLTDADLARRLYQRATASPEPAIADLQAALDLVTGPVLDQRRPTGYLWLLDTLLETELTALICDIAHTLAGHWLTHARPDLATSVSKTALTAGSRDDTTYLDLIAAAEASGHRPEAEHWLRQLLNNHDTDDTHDLPTRTTQRLAHLLPDKLTGNPHTRRRH